ncbi:MAG: AAA family ATPase, partial [Verrucomicrobiales bacterium]
MDHSHDKTPAGLPLLATKHFAPRWRPSLVSRPHLLARLNQGTGGTLTLIAAPAGFGKTTLLGEWLALRPETERPAAWVSLDSGDNDPALFWAYVVTALRRVLPEVGASALSLLQSPQPPPIELILTALINELAAIEDGITLVLDDLHVVDSVPIHTGIAFLLDHLPPRMRLVIASRADPPLPLARLRSHADLTEIRATDLRFTPDEASTFLTEAMGLDLSIKDIEALESRTEGWIAGLQMAALS